MNQCLCFIIVFLLSFSNLWANYTEDEIKKMWVDTEFDFKALFQRLNARKCHKSEKKFGECLMAFNELLLSIKRDGKDGESYQLRVSETNELEIVFFSKKNFPGAEDLQALRDRRRESFQSFYQNNIIALMNRSGELGLESPPHIQQFDNLVQKILELAKTVPGEDECYLAGQTYKFYLKEGDPYSDFYPSELDNQKSYASYKSVGIGIFSEFYETEDGTRGLVVYPIKGSPAEKAGLQRGDIILSIDAFDITALPLDADKETLDRVHEMTKGLVDSQVNLKVQKICDNGKPREKEITVTRSPFFYLPYCLLEAVL